MATFTKRTRADADPGAQTSDEDERLRRCSVSDCPMRGTISREGSRYTCAPHHFAQPGERAAITQALLEHRWLIDHITQVTRAVRKGEQVAALIEDFWRTDPPGAPSARELKHPALYLARMHDELAFRCGVRRERPAPRPEPPPLKRLPTFDDVAAPLTLGLAAPRRRHA